MPWKVFTLSLALTNFGDKLANDQFIQRLNASYCLNIAPKWAIRSLNYFVAIWRSISRSYKKSRRMFIQAHLAMACKVCFIFVRYLVLLFLVWKIYWNMVASTLLHFYLSSKGMDSTFLRTSFLSTCSLVKYLQVLFPFELSTDIFH